MKKFFSFLIALLLALSVATGASASKRIDASAAVMVDASTGQVIYEQKPNKKLPVASVSKLLTIAVIHDELKQNVITANSKVQVTPDVAAISNDPSYSSIGLQAGQSYTVRELVNAAMVKSADGATLALAMADGSNIEEFNLKLQQKAKDLGLKKCSIVNPVGLTNGDLKNLKLNQYSDKAENAMTAADAAILARYLIRSYPDILQVTAQKSASFYIAKNKTVKEENLNKMLPGDKYTVSGVQIDGLKTGTSDAAGACFVSTGLYRGHRIITVVLHANGNDKDARFTTTQQLYNMLKQTPLQEITLPKNLRQQRVANGNQRTTDIKPQKLMIWGSKPVRHYTLAVNYDHQKQNKRGRLLAPIRKNERVGEIELSSPDIRTINGEPLTYDLYSEEQVPRGNFWQLLWH